MCRLSFDILSLVDELQYVSIIDPHCEHLVLCDVLAFPESSGVADLEDMVNSTVL